MVHFPSRKKKSPFVIINDVSVYVIISINKKGVKPSVTRLSVRLPPSDLFTQQAKNSPHPNGANFQSACSRVMKIGGIQQKENKSQKLNLMYLVSLVQQLVSYSIRNRKNSKPPLLLVVQRNDGIRNTLLFVCKALGRNTFV